MIKVLVVDDAVVIREKLKMIFKNIGYDVNEASNGSEALIKYKTYKPDVVTLDITMPEVDGIQTVKLLKKEDPNAIIIMVSAISQKAVILDALNEGAVNFVLKPFDSKKIIKVVEETLIKHNKTNKNISEEMKRLQELNRRTESEIDKFKL